MDKAKFKVRVNQRGDLWKWDEGKELARVYRGQVDGKFGKLGLMDIGDDQQVTFAVRGRVLHRLSRPGHEPEGRPGVPGL